MREAGCTMPICARMFVRECRVMRECVVGRVREPSTQSWSSILVSCTHTRTRKTVAGTAMAVFRSCVRRRAISPSTASPRPAYVLSPLPGLCAHSSRSMHAHACLQALVCACVGSTAAAAVRRCRSRLSINLHRVTRARSGGFRDGPGPGEQRRRTLLHTTHAHVALWGRGGTKCASGRAIC